MKCKNKHKYHQNMQKKINSEKSKTIRKTLRKFKMAPKVVASKGVKNAVKPPTKGAKGEGKQKHR